MGLALARSITGAVHELFAGTERVRQGDFGHRIPVLANDQLGELANSFNQMTGSIEDLLRQAAEKKRLEEEMRLAREIQMSLLPRGPLLVPGITDQRAVRAGARGGRRLLRRPGAAGRALRRAHRRRVGQGHVRRALHGRAQGAHPVAEPDSPLAPRPADQREPAHLDAPRQPQLHHDDLRGDRPGGRRHDLRPGGPHADAVPAGRERLGQPARSILAPDGLVLGPAHRRRRALRQPARGGHPAAFSRATCWCCSPTASARR